MSGVSGTNTPPISFPGISSGIDYNSIIQKLTSMTLAQNVSLNAQMSTLSNANMELIKINSMFASLQNALTALSQPNMFNAYNALSSNTSVATAQGIPSVAATPGTYVIQSATLATASQAVNASNAGHSMTDLIGGTPSDQVPLAQSYSAITASNGSGSSGGKITVDGVTVSYDVNSQSLQTILSNIQSAVRASADASFTIGYAAGTDTIQVSGNQPVSLGSAGDSGNLLTVLKLDQAQINNSGPGPYTVTGTSGVGGINQAAALNGANAAGFKTSVTSGTFTINGVQISVNSAGDNVASILARINASNAGVVATYNGALNQIQLNAKATGPQSIVVGAPSDTSNFLSAAGLTSAAGATTTLGTQAKVTVQTPSGGSQTFYSNSNNVTSAIPGIQLSLLSSSVSPYTITVTQDSSHLVTAIGTFVSAYNSVINEINQATAAPVVVGGKPGTQTNGTSQALGGGVLFGNADVGAIKDRIESLVSGLVSGNGTTYNSMSSIGLSLDDSFSVLTTSNNGTTQNGGTAAAGSDASSPVQTTTYSGTSGQFVPLDATKLQAALSSNPSAVQNLLNGSNGIVTQLGTYLTTVTGLPTMLSSGLAGSIPTVSIMQDFENSNSDQIKSIQQQIALVTQNANQQADSLRQQFVSVEGQLAEFQSLQQSLSGFFKQSGG